MLRRLGRDAARGIPGWETALNTQPWPAPPLRRALLSCLLCPALSFSIICDVGIRNSSITALQSHLVVGSKGSPDLRIATSPLRRATPGRRSHKTHLHLGSPTRSDDSLSLLLASPRPADFNSPHDHQGSQTESKHKNQATTPRDPQVSMCS